MNCPKCFSPKLRFDSSMQFDSGGNLFLGCQCESCDKRFVVMAFIIIQELKRLRDLEQAINELHYILSSHPTIQRLSANENDSRIDDAFLKLESLMDLDKIYAEIQN